jgi:hypothetical protein
MLGSWLPGLMIALIAAFKWPMVLVGWLVGQGNLPQEKIQDTSD